jgi:hypothetical protein
MDTRILVNDLNSLDYEIAFKGWVSFCKQPAHIATSILDTLDIAFPSLTNFDTKGSPQYFGYRWALRFIRDKVKTGTSEKEAIATVERYIYPTLARSSFIQHSLYHEGILAALQQVERSGSLCWDDSQYLILLLKRVRFQ